jgi:glycosyltransferase involved in cell wall biosynthesis
MKMKIAYIVPYVPNLIRTRPYNLIVQLAALGNDVTVFTLGSGRQDAKDAEALRSKVAHVHYMEQSVWHSLWNSVWALPSRRPLQTVYSWNPALAKQLTDLLEIQGAFDVVHVEHLRGSRYGQYIKSKLSQIPVIWDSVDCISHLFKQASQYNTGGGFGRFITRFELGRTRLAEGKLVGEFNHVLVTSETDKKALLELTLPYISPAPISVLSNGVDLQYFHPAPDIQRDDETVVFSGKMSYHANISMVKYLIHEIMPGVWQKRPNVKLVIVGKDPPVDIQALGADPRITITGTVDDIRPYLWKATVAVVPLVYGAGIQNKILEAMACGTPVITTSKALSSLQTRTGEGVLVADRPEEFSSGILQLINDLKLQHEIADSGLRYVQKFHDWTKIALNLTEIYKKTIENLAVFSGR